MANNENRRKKVKQTDSNAVAAGKKVKKKKAGKKHPVLFYSFVFCFCIFVSVMLTGLIVGGSVLSYMDSNVNAEKLLDLENYKDSQNRTTIMYAYDSDDNIIELTRLHGEENRVWISYEDMPEALIWSFICVEDERFYEHEGVDWRRTIAVLVVPKYKGQGGSTITQQLIKNLTDDNENTFFRKFKEIVRALNLEKNYSKKEIIEAYLNTVSLGAGCYGVQTAAETYFGKNASELTLEECATLAGITQAPYSQNPYSNFDKCMERKDYCLDKLLEHGVISEKKYNKLHGKDVKVLEKGASSSDEETTAETGDILSWYEEYTVSQVIADLQEKYECDYYEAWRMVYYGGLQIYSAVDLEIQKTLENSYKTRAGFPKANYNSYGKLPESAMTIMDYEGRIVALVGGTGEKTANRAYNRATDVRAKRQPGSSIKPLSVYAPAVDRGIVTAQSAILEEAITLNGKPWPRNFNGDHGSGDYVTVENALVRSLNTVPVRILKDMLGVKRALEYCNNAFKLNLSKTDEDLSPLGVGGTNTGVTTLEMAAAFATFGNGGRYFDAYSYYKVTDRNGNILLDNTDNKGEQVIKTSTASSMLSMLTKAVTESIGTGYGSKISGFQTFAKTGTTSDNCDKWYCGGTPHYVAAVWYGYDYRGDLRTGSTNPAKTIFKYVFSDIHSGLSAKSFSDVAESASQKVLTEEQ